MYNKTSIIHLPSSSSNQQKLIPLRPSLIPWQEPGHLIDPNPGLPQIIPDLLGNSDIFDSFLLPRIHHLFSLHKFIYRMLKLLKMPY